MITATLGSLVRYFRAAALEWQLSITQPVRNGRFNSVQFLLLNGNIRRTHVKAKKEGRLFVLDPALSKNSLILTIRNAKKKIFKKSAKKCIVKCYRSLPDMVEIDVTITCYHLSVSYWPKFTFLETTVSLMKSFAHRFQEIACHSKVKFLLISKLQRSMWSRSCRHAYLGLVRCKCIIYDLISNAQFIKFSVDHSCGKTCQEEC